MNDKISECALIYRSVRSSSDDSPGRLHFYNPQDIVDHLFEPSLHTPTDFREGSSRGTLFLVRLRPGSYKITNTYIEFMPYSSMSSAGWFWEAGDVEFQVSEGKATYLGRFWAHLDNGRDKDGVPTVQGTYFEITSHLSADFEIARCKGLELGQDQVLDASGLLRQVNNKVLRPAAP